MRTPSPTTLLLSVAVSASLLAGPAALAATSETHTPSHAAPAAAAEVTVGPALTVRGAVRDPLRLTRADLDALPQQTETVDYTANGVPVTATFTGPLLLDVLDQAQPRFDPTVKNDALRFAVIATGSDGYQAVVSWGEIDPGFEGKPVLVATTQDGAELARPRLVVPGDAKGGRYVSDLVRLKLLDLGR